jgi:hypothetical protein
MAARQPIEKEQELSPKEKEKEKEQETGAYFAGKVLLGFFLLLLIIVVGISLMNIQKRAIPIPNVPRPNEKPNAPNEKPNAPNENPSVPQTTPIHTSGPTSINSPPDSDWDDDDDDHERRYRYNRRERDRYLIHIPFRRRRPNLNCEWLHIDLEAINNDENYWIDQDRHDNGFDLGFSRIQPKKDIIIHLQVNNCTVSHGTQTYKVVETLISQDRRDSNGQGIQKLIKQEQFTVAYMEEYDFNSTIPATIVESGRWIYKAELFSQHGKLLSQKQLSFAVS